MRRLTLIALAIGATAILAACGGSNADALTGKQLAADLDHREGAGVPGRDPACRPGRSTRSRSTTDGTVQWDRPTATRSAARTRPAARTRIEITPGIATMAFCPEWLARHPVRPRADQASKTYSDRERRSSRSRSADGGTLTSSSSAWLPASTAAATATCRHATPAPTASPTPKPTADADARADRQGPHPDPGADRGPDHQADARSVQRPDRRPHADPGADPGADAQADCPPRPRRRPRPRPRASPAGSGS